jgi:hypothetical protein
MKAKFLKTWMLLSIVHWLQLLTSCQKENEETEQSEAVKKVP